MKKFLILGLLLLAALQAFAGQSTVTLTLTATTPKYYVYTASFSTGISVADSAYIYASGTTPYNIEEIGYKDSCIVVQATSTEATADSIRLTVTYEVSALTAPTTSQYSTAYTDTASLTNLKPGGVSLFNIRRRAGLNRVLRLLITENDSNKDATQTVTLQIIVPRN